MSRHSIPRVTCPACDHTVVTAPDGSMLIHSNDEGQKCSASGHFVREVAAPAALTSKPEPAWKGMSHTEQRHYVRQFATIENERKRAAFAAAERRLDFVRPVYVGSYR
jgi:hypothetical protein